MGRALLVAMVVFWFLLQKQLMRDVQGWGASGTYGEEGDQR